jgi:hypothetical protein
MTSPVLALTPVPLTAGVAPLLPADELRAVLSGAAGVLGAHVDGPSGGSFVLVPLRGGRPAGSLRLALAGAAPEVVVRAGLGALGRFGGVEGVVAAVQPGPASPAASARVVAALEERSRLHPRPRLQIVVLEAAAQRPGGAMAQGILPDAGQEDALEVASEVDRLLDRHPRAELPRALLSGVDDLVLRAAGGPVGHARPAALAALVVSAQRSAGAERVLRLARGDARSSAPGPERVRALLGRAAALAPATERPAVLVLLGRLLAGQGRAADALGPAQEAVRLDPHHLGARRLVSELTTGRPERAA